MTYFDSHAHFDHLDAPAIAGVLSRAAAAGVNRVLAVGGNPAANEAVVRVAAAHPAQVRAAVGLDREHAGREELVPSVEALLSAPGILAVGEIGLDYHYHPESATGQKKLFARMLDLAAARKLPVVVHSREADADTLELLGGFVAKWPDAGRPPGVLHCFTGGPEFARKLLEIGFLLSFSGIVSFRNADALREVARTVPADRLLVETDAPYLAPVPFRGQVNEPALLPHVVEVLAKIRNDSTGHIAHITAQNACRLLGWRQEET